MYVKTKVLQPECARSVFYFGLRQRCLAPVCVAAENFLNNILASLDGGLIPPGARGVGSATHAAAEGEADVAARPADDDTDDNRQLTPIRRP